MSELVTGEAVALDLRTAALPSRAVAAGIDVALQVLLLVAAGVVFGLAAGDASDALAAALGVLLLVVVYIVYPVLSETLLRGRTAGKAAMGLRVVRDDGGPISFRHALVRGLSGAFLEKPGLSVFLLPVVVSLSNSRSKRVGDLLAGTVVVQERVALREVPAAQMPPPLAAWAATLELSRLPDELALSVRSFVARAPQLTPAAREDLGGRLVAAVLAVTAPPPPPGTPGWAVLAAVLAERRRRSTPLTGPPTHPYGPFAPSVPYQPAVPFVPPAAPPAPPSGGFSLPS